MTHDIAPGFWRHRRRPWGMRVDRVIWALSDATFVQGAAMYRSPAGWRIHCISNDANDMGPPGDWEPMEVPR